MKTKNQTESLKFRREDGEFSNAHNNALTSKQHRIWKRRNKVKIALVACALAVGIGGGIGAGYAIFNSSTPTKEKKLGIYFAKEMENKKIC
ncbi:MAG: hypothetical protein LBF00_00560 [Mycoplasmataceae bacterium]|jgi:hypothetical protein|nr:hypothetical protein [Mycoplasmataceae bacterium]